MRRFILLIAFLSPLLAQERCWTFIQRLELNKNNPEAQSPEEKDYFSFSGIEGVQNLGSKTGCEANPSRRYYVIGEIALPKPELHSQAFRQFHESGVCLPDYCNKDILESNHQELLNLCRINGREPEGNLALWDPNGSPPRGKGFYILIAIFGILVVLCLISTISVNMGKLLKQSEKNNQVSKGWHPNHWLLKSFDVVQNVKSLYATAQESGQSDHLAIFGFVRVLSMIRILGFHSVGHYQVWNHSIWPEHLPWIIPFLSNGYTSIGQFFFMGGFLAVFTLIGKATKEGVGFSRLVSDIVHRLFKIYPGFWVTILVYWLVLPGLTNGTLWNRNLGEVSSCGEEIPQKLFLVDNIFVHHFQHCAGWTWYITVDFQVYPVVILLAYLYVTKKRRIAYLATIIMTAVSLTIGLTISTFDSDLGTWKPLAPARAYEILIGVFFGIQYYEYSKLKLKSNWNYICEKYVFVGYISIFLGVVINCIAIFTKRQETNFTESQWEYIRRILVSFGTPLVFVPLANNTASLLKRFMNLRIFQSLGKLCFGAYLLHLYFLFAIKFTRESLKTPYDFGSLMREVVVTLIKTFIVAFIYYLVLEKPLLNIENYFSKGKKSASSVAVVANPAPEGYSVFKNESENLKTDKEQSTSEISPKDLENVQK